MSQDRDGNQGIYTLFNTLDRFQGNLRNIWPPNSDLEKPEDAVGVQHPSFIEHLTTWALTVVSIMILPFSVERAFRAAFTP